jgi:nicotinamide phosphoribosyltransferase
MNNNTSELSAAVQNGIMYQIRQKYGTVFDTDSYKLSHHCQYVDGADAMASYIESRGGLYDVVVWFGLQLIIKEYLLQRLTHKQVDNIIAWVKIHMMGNVTDDLEIAFRAVVDEYDGKMPIRIRAADEGLVIPVKNVLAVIETTTPDPRLFTLVSYFETKLLRVWAPTTVATTSYHIRQVILDALNKTSDDPLAEINFKLHDFGSRGGSSCETIAFNGAGHLVSFMGSDNTASIMVTEIGYNEPMAAFSIPASEHSTTTTHGRGGEAGLVSTMFDNYAKPEAIFATVADSYDVLSFIRDIAPTFKDRLIESGATWVIRPDSGDPIEMPIKTVIELEKVFGSTINSKKYKVLNNVRVIQGDGIKPKDVATILNRLEELGYSASNMAFGMGGGLLQDNDRDTQKFSMKCSAVRVSGVWWDVYKNPAVYDDDWNVVDEESFKKSKAGRITLLRNPETGEYMSRREDETSKLFNAGWEDMLHTVYENGEIVKEFTFAEVRNNAGTIVT